MDANKAQERFILNARKQKSEKEKKKKTVSKQKTSSTFEAPLTNDAKIKAQKQKYDEAYKNKDFLGMRKANEKANNVREKAGLPHYSSAVGDKQASLANARSLNGLKQNISNQMTINANKKIPNLSANHPLNRENKAVSPIPKRVLNDMFDKNENYVDKFKKGNIGGGVASLIGETIQLPQSGLMNLSNNINSVAHGKGLQPYKRMMDYTDYESQIESRNNVKPLSQVLGNKNKTLGNIYSVGMDIATDPLNLLDVGAAQTAKQLKTLGSAKYADNLVDGKLVPTVGSPTRNVATIGEKVEANTPRNAKIKAIEPQNVSLGANVPQVEKPTPNIPYNSFAKQQLPKFKDLGADVNKFPTKTKISQFKTNTMRNSKVFSEAEKNIDDAVYEYEVVSEKKSLQEAKQRLQADFKGEVKDLSAKKDFDGVDLDTSMGIAEQYLKEAEETGDYKQFLNWTKNIQEKGTQGGQMIQAFAKYTRTPEGALVKANQEINRFIKGLAKNNPKLLETINEETQEIIYKALSGKFDKIKGSDKFVEDIRNLAIDGNINKETVEELVKGKYDIPVLTNDDVKAITENMKLGQEATDSYMREMYFNKAEQIISNKIPASGREKFRALQRLNLILNPKTLITRNPLGNVVLGTAENIKDIPASVVDRLVSLKTGQRTTTGLTPQKFIDQAEGVKQGFTEWGKDVKYGVDTSPSRGKYELPNKRIFKGELLNKMDMFERNALQLGDRPFYQSAYNSRIGELKKLGVTGEEAEKQAKLYALDRVFQNDSALSRAASKIRKSLNEMVGGFPIGDLIMPFTQTPANIMDKLLDYSPVGLAKAVKEWGNIGKGTFDQKHFVDLIGRTFTGAGIAMLGYTLAKNSIITNDLYGNNKDLYKAKQMAGQKSYAFKIDGKYYTFDWASPIGNIFAAAADAQKAMADEDDLLDALGIGVVTAVDTVFTQSFLSGVFDMLSGYSPASGIAKSLLGSTTQLTPTVGSNIARTIDPYMRETYDPSKLTETKNKLIARIPFASKTLPKKLGTDGKPIMQNQGRGIGSRIVENFIAPYNLGVENADKVNDEAMRLQSATGNNSVLLNSADKYVEYGGQKTQLTTGQYQTYQRLIGKEAYNQISSLMDTEQYKQMNDVQKSEAVQKINDDVRANAKKKMLVNIGYNAEEVWFKDLGQTATAGYKSMQNVSPEDYYKTYREMLGKTSEIGSDSNIYKALALSEMGADENYYNAFGIVSKKTDYKALADNFKQNGITANQYYNYRLNADTDGNNSVKKDEAINMLEKTDLTKDQKRLLFKALCPSVKKIPY